MLKLRNAAQTVRVTAVKSTKEIWEEIRPRDAKVAWHKLLWYPLHVPKHSIISWMIILDRLPTKDIMQRFGLITNDLCMFCSEATETRNHLFAEYSKTASIWKSILQLSLNMNFSNWTILLQWATSSWKGKSLLTCILKLSWNAFN
ncbi:uncharacterized protein LOC120162227 [Hibiscus syriacus]|uniref:uncharacterized protein LOC120162227 n=1 Tax=Hibiscus syriacus TaxID=106335 RepID=UPI001925068D|nr:uncharacterized protein LOC120162227 [Hibiscus syriacus]